MEIIITLVLASIAVSAWDIAKSLHSIKDHLTRNDHTATVVETERTT